mgnify:CR=1 FL=1
MIEINLLPQRYRQVDSTPARVGIAVVVSIIFLSAAAIALGFFIIHHQSTKQDLEAARQRNASLKNQHDSLKDIQKQYKELQNRKNTVVKLFRSRMLVAQRLARLQELVPENVMLESISLNTNIEQTRSGKGKTTSKIVRQIDLNGIVRAEGTEIEYLENLAGQDGRDDERMTTIERFTDSLESDTDGFYKDCVGDIEFISAIVKGTKVVSSFFIGNPEPYKLDTVPVYTFSVRATAEFSEGSDSKTKGGK